jgi:hypothetical protein
VRDCPEYAAEIGHQISLRIFFGRRFSQDIRHFDLEECIRCGVFFAPRLQCNKAAETTDELSISLCTRCRSQQLMRILVYGDPPPLSPRREQADVSQSVSCGALLL